MLGPPPTDGAEWKVAIIATSKQLAMDARDALTGMQYTNTYIVAFVTITSIQRLDIIGQRSLMVNPVQKYIYTERRQSVYTMFRHVEIVFAVTEVDSNEHPSLFLFLMYIAAEYNRIVMYWQLHDCITTQAVNVMTQWLWMMRTSTGGRPVKDVYRAWTEGVTGLWENLRKLTPS
jgi:hypothetical protein